MTVSCDAKKSGNRRVTIVRTKAQELAIKLLPRENATFLHNKLFLIIDIVKTSCNIRGKPLNFRFFAFFIAP